MVGLVDRYGQPIPANGRNGHAPGRASRTAGLRRPLRSIEGRYDAAQTTDQNSAHWAAADALDADAANSLAIRKRIRERARYEVANNPVLKGIVRTEGNYEIGTGPTLQVQTADPGFNRQVEARWNEWARAVNLAGKLRTMAMARVVDGESLAVLVANPAVENPVKLDLRPIECDQLTSPYGTYAAQNYIDGVTLDDYGNPVSYDILRRHPGANWISVKPEFDTVPARLAVHWFGPERPGQHRGVSELAASLGLLPGSRRFVNATVKAAETAADISVFFETDLLPGMEPDEIEPGTMEIPMGTMMQAPFGHKAKQIAAEHPNTEFRPFLKETHGQAARPLSMPNNIATCDSSDYNFASGQLDQLTYFVAVGVTQADTDQQVIRKIFAAWYAEASLQYGWALSVPPPYTVYWAGRPYSNPVDEATAISTNLGDGVTTHALEYARRGLDCEQEWLKQASLLGITIDEYRRLIVSKTFGVQLPVAGSQLPAEAQPTTDNRQPTTPLNGSQITAAIDVVVKLREQTIAPAAATELLAGLGIERAKAAEIVAQTPQGLDNRGGDVAFKREVLKQLLSVPAAREAVFNGVDVEDLISQTGLTPEAGYQAPFIPVVAPAGPLVSGDVVKDPQGDTVGGDVRAGEQGSRRAGEGEQGSRRAGEQGSRGTGEGEQGSGRAGEQGSGRAGEQGSRGTGQKEDSPPRRGDTEKKGSAK